ncbi:hypothetical protein ACS0TY_013648 [Phlomoides rotata]
MAPSRKRGQPRVNQDSTPELQEEPIGQNQPQPAEPEQPPETTPGVDIARAILTSLQELVRQQTPTPPPIYAPMPNMVPRANDFVEQFRRLQPPKLNGKEGPLGTEEWLAGLERIFRHMVLTDAQKISCAQFQLTEDAAQWWESHERTLDTEVMHALLWEDFKEAVMERYFPQVLRDQKEQEFVTLQQGNLSVTEYERKFNQLSRYAPHLVEIDARKARRFERGLRSEIRGILAGANLSNYREVFSRALNVSIGLKLEHKQPTTTIPINHNWQPNFKRNSNPPPSGNDYNAPRNKSNCVTYGKGHLGPCLKGTEVCYRCHQTGHKITECPIPPNANHHLNGNSQYQPQPINSYQTRPPHALDNRLPGPPRRGPPNQDQWRRAQLNAILNNDEGKEEALLLEH